MVKKYTHLFFDLDNTLWDFERNSYDALLVVFNYYKLDVQGFDFNQFFNVYTSINRFCWQKYRQGALSKKELMSLRFQRTFEELNVHGIDPLEINLQYLSEMPNQKRLIKDSRQLLEYLKSKRYLLFIITNGFTEVQHKKLETAGIRKYFTKIFTSEQVNAPKPSSIIFEYAVKSANAKKTSSLMIGDDAEVDIQGAVNFGIDAVLVGENKVIKQNLLVEGKHPTVYLVSNLSELTSIL